MPSRPPALFPTFPLSDGRERLLVPLARPEEGVRGDGERSTEECPPLSLSRETEERGRLAGGEADRERRWSCLSHGDGEPTGDGDGRTTTERTERGLSSSNETSDDRSPSGCNSTLSSDLVELVLRALRWRLRDAAAWAFSKRSQKSVGHSWQYEHRESREHRFRPSFTLQFWHLRCVSNSILKWEQSLNFAVLFLEEAFVGVAIVPRVRLNT